MRKRGYGKLIVFLLLVLGTFFTTLAFGEAPSLGLDLQGGVSVVLQPVAQSGNTDKVTPEALEQTKTIIEKRVNAIGVGEPDISVQGKTIVVQLPGIKDQRRALALVGETAELRFRPVLEDLGGAFGAKEKARVAKLRKELKIPEGVSALQVYNAELAARGEPTIPDPATSTTTAAPPPTVTVAPSAEVGTSPAPTTSAAPTTTSKGSAAPAASVPGGEGTGGRTAAKVAKLRSQADPATTVAPVSEAPTPVAGEGDATTTTASTTTTTIDPTPKNQYGVPIYKDKNGELNTKFRELAGLEQQEQQAEVGLTPAKDDIADKEVVLADSTGQRYRLGPTKLTGKAVETADAGLDQRGQWEVRPTFRAGKDGIDLFNAAAAICYAGQPECPQLAGREHGAMAIVLDSVVLTAPSINNASFARNQITISGAFTEQKAKDVATALRYGSLPLILEPQQVQTVSATIGKGALRAALIAGAIGLGFVALWMLFYYRVLGAVTILALSMSAMMMWTIISFMGTQVGLTLTLAGIVGIIVSIGVSLDSSVVHFENLKEDVRNGRSLRSTVDHSFSTAFSTTVKADVSSLIGAVILYLLSIGPVRGFALFLAISTCLDLLTAYFFNRPVVALLGRTSWANHPERFGIPVDDLPSAAAPAGKKAAAPSAGAR